MRIASTKHLLLTIIVVGGTSAAVAQMPPPPPRNARNIDIMPVEELRPGMKGYGLTVFRGTEPERFDVTILGVLKNRFADGDMIVVRLEHEELLDIGGVAGMSGSPIFVNDRLVGAFAYGWGFSVRPIGGVTPIERMLDVLDMVTKEPQVDQREVPVSLRHWPEARAAFGDHQLARESVTLSQTELAHLGILDRADPSATVTLSPLSTPLMVSTTSPRIMKEVERVFGGSGLLPVMAPMQGGLIGDTRNRELTNIAMTNGGALSVIYCEGDLNLAAMGTTTLVQDDRLIGFGHPMMGLGAVDAPVAVAEVISVIPSVARPFKIGNAVRTVGALRQDRLPAIGATLSAHAHMVPMKLRVKAPETSTDREFNYRMWNNRDFLPQIAGIAYMAAIDSVRMEGPMSLQLDYNVRLSDGRGLRRTQYVSSPMMAQMLGGMALVRDLDALLNNRFEPVSVDQIEVSVGIGSELDIMVLERFQRLSDDTLEPGDVFRGELQFGQWREEPKRVPVRFEIPRDLKPGSYQLHLVDGGARSALELQFRPQLDRVESLDDMLRRAEPSFPFSNLYVVLVEPREQIVLNGEPLPGLPPSIAQTTRATIRDTKLASSTALRLVRETREPLGSMVAGTQIVPLTIVERK